MRATATTGTTTAIAVRPAGGKPLDPLDEPPFAWSVAGPEVDEVVEDVALFEFVVAVGVVSDVTMTVTGGTEVWPGSEGVCVTIEVMS